MEIMVGVVIGLIAVLVIYQVFALSEGIKRNTTAVGDSQQNGLFTSFTLGLELANAGNSIEVAAKDLESCPDTGNIATTFRPIPVLITPGSTLDSPDEFVVNYSMGTVSIGTVPFMPPSSDTSNYFVQSPTGFKVGDRIVAAQAGACEMSTVTAVGAPNAEGVVHITHSGVSTTYTTSAVLFNMGPAIKAQRVRYDVASEVLRSQDLFTAGATPNPLSSNVVNMKLLYGIDPTNSGTLTWVRPIGAWAPATVMSMTASQLNQIKAVRIGVVVRSEQWDKNNIDVSWSMFGGIYSGVHAASNGNWRFRTYETIVPLRNTLWNPLS